MTITMIEGLPRKRLGLRWGIGTNILCLLAVVLAAAPVARAQVDEPRMTFRGFGTLALTTHDADGIEFRRNVNQGRGIESGDVGLGSDSLAGLQLELNFNPRVDFMLQGVSRMNAEGNWTPRLTQAFLRYSPDESLVLRAGRFGYDIYLLAESRQVGYSYLAVRPSQDFYGLVTNDEIDGLDIGWTGRLGRGLVRARVFGGAGSDETALADGTSWGEESDVIGFSLDYQYQSLTARVAMLEVGYGGNPDLRALGEMLVDTSAPNAVRIGSELIASRQKSRGFQIGLAYDDGPLQAQLLYGRISSDSIAGPRVNAVYGQVGYRLRDFTPFVSFAKSRDRDARVDTGLQDVPEFALLEAAVRDLQQSVRATQHSASAGVRYDFSPRLDFKLQADLTTIHDSALNFDRRPPGSGDVRMTVITAGVDFVF